MSLSTFIKCLLLLGTGMFFGVYSVLQYKGEPQEIFYYASVIAVIVLAVILVMIDFLFTYFSKK